MSLQVMVIIIKHGIAPQEVVAPVICMNVIGVRIALGIRAIELPPLVRSGLILEIDVGVSSHVTIQDI